MQDFRIKSPSADIDKQRQEDEAAQREYNRKMTDQMYREDHLERKWGIPTFA